MDIQNVKRILIDKGFTDLQVDKLIKNKKIETFILDDFMLDVLSEEVFIRLNFDLFNFIDKEKFAKWLEKDNRICDTQSNTLITIKE